MSMVWDGYPGGGGSELLALLALADWSDDNGKCYPSMAAIARKTRLSRSQSQRIVHKLIEDEFVAVVGNETGGAPGTSRKYRINLSMLTGRMDATGSAHATGRTHAQEGSHGCGETGSTHATQTVIEPSITVSTREQARSLPLKSELKGKAGTTLAQFLEACKSDGVKPIPEDDPVFEYAAKVRIDDDMVGLCWQEFKTRYLPTTKRQKDWRAHFRNAVSRNWYGFWFIRGDDPAGWTTTGEQARRAVA